MAKVALRAMREITQMENVRINCGNDRGAATRRIRSGKFLNHSAARIKDNASYKKNQNVASEAPFYGLKFFEQR